MWVVKRMWEAFLLAGRCGATSDPDGDDSPSPDSKPGNGNRRRRVKYQQSKWNVRWSERLHQRM